VDAIFEPVSRLEEGLTLPITTLRVTAGSMMIHHGSEGGFWPGNTESEGFKGFTEGVIAPFFGFLPGSPEFWSLFHDYAEFWGGVCLVIGLCTRPAAFLLFLVMLAAVSFHLRLTGLQGFPFGHVDNFSYDWEEPALYAFIFLLFARYGPGRLSADAALYEQIGSGSENK
jgi:putative oxidoreductase